MTDYDKLKEELSNISSILEKFPDDLKSKVFDILIHSFTGNDDFLSKKEPKTGNEIKDKAQEQKNGIKSETGSIGKSSKKTSSAKKTAESYSIDRDLNLRGGNGIPSFKDFFDEKKPTSTSEINVLSVYYLKNHMKLAQVTLNHVYTCYKEINQKPADYFKQSFVDTKNKKGYIEYDDNWNLSIPHRGISFVEHDLPHQKKKTK